MFKELQATVVLVSGGVFKVATLYSRSGQDRTYAKHAGGFVRLGPQGATSKPKLSWESLDAFGDKFVQHPMYGPLLCP